MKNWFFLFSMTLFSLVTVDAQTARELYNLATKETNPELRWLLINRVVSAGREKGVPQAHLLLHAQTAVAMFKHGKGASFLTTARDSYQEILLQNDIESVANYELGKVYILLGNIPAAYEKFNVAAQSDDDNLEYLLNRAMCSIHPRISKDSLAIIDFTKIINVRRRKERWQHLMPEAYHGRGYAYLQRRDTAKALNDLRQSLLLSKDDSINAKTFCYLGQILYERKQFRAAKDTLTLAIERNVQYHQALDTRGLSWLALGEVERALADFNLAITWAKTEPAYYHHRSLASAAQRQYIYASEDLDKAIQFQSNEAVYWFQRGWVRLRLQHDSAAKADLRQSLQTALRLHDSLKGRAFCYLGWATLRTATNRSDAYTSMEHFTEAIRRFPNDAFAYCGRGWAQMETEPFHTAQMDFKTALNLSPTLAKAHLGSGIVRVKQHEADAIRDLDQAILLMGQNRDDFSDVSDLATAYQYRAKANRHVSNWAAAVSDYTKLMELQPDSLNYGLYRAQMRYQLKQYEAVLTDLKPILERFPNLADALELKSECFYHQERWRESLHIAQNLPKKPQYAPLLARTAQAYRQYRARTEKPIVKLYNSNSNSRSFSLDTAQHFSTYFTGHIISMSPIQRLELTVNGRKRMLPLTTRMDTLFDFATDSIRFDKSEAEVLLTVTNQAGDTLLNYTPSYDMPRCNRTQKRLALVISNKNYLQNALNNLENTLNDGHDMTDSLRRLGFEVDTLYDGDYNTMRRVIRAFCSKSKDYELGFFYYSGHGQQSGTEGYLLPVDMREGRSLERNAISLTHIWEELKSEKPCNMIFVIDACRDSNSVQNGFNTNQITPPDDLLVAFATRLGKTASDKSDLNDRNGLFSSYLLKGLATESKKGNIF
jgi:tetratricopeptide (TPR) repeat protein